MNLLNKIDNGINDLKNDILFQEIILESIQFLNLTDKEFAQQIKISRPTVTRWKNGNSSPHFLMRIGIYTWIKNKLQNKE